MSANLKQYISSFNIKLNTVDVNEISIHSYPVEYLQLLLKNSTYYLHIYAHVLEKLLNNIDKPKEEIVLADYGAGNGLLGIFAKHCGFKKVYLNDFSEQFIESSKQLSSVLNIEVDGFIEGDCDAVIDFCKTNNAPDAVIGTDVIEHIYSLENFFSCLHTMNKKMVTVFTTASVTANPFKSKQLKKLQIEDERKGSNSSHAKPGDAFAGLPFIEIRRKILQKNFIDLNEEAINKLATATRGMIEKDVIKAGNVFLQNGSIPKPPTHATNTCDPITGSWTERLLAPIEYERIYNKAGFKLKVFNGFYNQWQTGMKGIFLSVANKTIALLGKQGNIISPFITLIGKDVNEQ